jgi:hypothetical protein
MIVYKADTEMTELWQSNIQVKTSLAKLASYVLFLSQAQGGALAYVSPFLFYFLMYLGYIYIYIYIYIVNLVELIILIIEFILFLSQAL